MRNNKEKTRLSSLRDHMINEEIDLVYVASRENHRYFCGFDNPDGKIIITREDAYVLADFRYTEAAVREVYRDFTVVEPEGGFFTVIEELADNISVKRLGIDERTITLEESDRLKKIFPESEFVYLNRLFLSLRAVKDEDEISAVIEAQKITDAAFEHIVNIIRPDMKELEIAAELEYFMKKAGAEDKSFETIAISGSKSSSPHGVPGNTCLEKGFLTMDYGAVVRGYHSDMTRTICIGKADPDMKRLYNTVKEAQRAVLDVISEGELCCRMDKCARDIIDKAGYKGAFGHSLGHGVGLQIHEAPNLSPSSGDARLTEGNIVTVEPGIYLSGKYGCRIENMVVITKGGARDITASPRDLIEIY